MNSNLHKAKRQKNDEFYTQYSDIEKEIECYLDYNPDVFKDKTVLLPCDDPEWSNFTKYFRDNFKRLRLKRLISTCYNRNSEKSSGLFSLIDETDKSQTCGKILIIDSNSLDADWTYLDGSGDFASEEITKLRDEAEIIITNPPFSKFRDFISWIMSAPKKKQLSVIGNVNAITYKDIFPLIASNQIWLGPASCNGSYRFYIPDSGQMMQVNIRWFTNLRYDRNLKHLPLMTMQDNIRLNKVKAYERYDNYDAIEVPFVSAIPSDYDGVMGVPITFLDKYSPEQFEIVTFIINDDGSEAVAPVSEVIHTHTHTHRNQQIL